MSAQERVLKLKEALEDQAPGGHSTKILDILRRLGMIDVDLRILTETTIGASVAKLKSSRDDSVASTARELIKKWKAVARKQGWDPSASGERAATTGPPPAKSAKESVLELKTTIDVFVEKRGRGEDVTIESLLGTLTRLDVVDVDRAILEETGIGMAVKELKSWGDEEITKNVKALLKKWRDMAVEQGAPDSKAEKAKRKKETTPAGEEPQKKRKKVGSVSVSSAPPAAAKANASGAKAEPSGQKEAEGKGAGKKKEAVATDAQQRKTAYVCLDLETTSKDSDVARIYDICAKIYGGNIEGEKATFQQYVNPDAEIPKEWVEKACVDLEKVKSGGALPHVLKQFQQWVSDETEGFEDVCFVGYNIKRYDIPILDLELLRCDADFQLKDIGDSVLDVLELVQDKQVWTSSKIGMPPKFGQEDVYRAVTGKDLPNSHSASGDVNGMITIIRRLDRKLDVGAKYISHLSYSDVDPGRLSKKEKEVAEKSIQRELLYTRHPIYKDQKRCNEILASIWKNWRKESSNQLSSPEAKRMGCIEIKKRGTGDSRRGHNGIQNAHGYWNWALDDRLVKLHQVACTARWGMKRAARTSAMLDMITASHLCQNGHCTNPEHLIWETLRANLSRKKCYGYAMEEERGKLAQTSTCQGPKCGHIGTRCLTCIPSEDLTEGELEFLNS